MRTPDAATATPPKKMSDFEADFDGAALAEAWRAHRREGLRHLVVTGRDGATLGTYAGDGAGDAAPPAQLVAAIVSQAQKMRLGNLESLVALYDRLCLVVLDAPPFAATVVAAPGADVDAILALRPALAARLQTAMAQSQRRTRTCRNCAGAPPRLNCHATPRCGAHRSSPTSNSHVCLAASFRRS